jgi:GNAT superfamily N-acetyltransferase
VDDILVVEPLAAHHDRAAFACGEPALDDYLRRQAAQDVRRRIAQVFVAVGAAPEVVLGYYTLSAASYDKAELPPALAKRLPHYPVPAAILGRLAVARAQQGRGFGERLLLDAVHRVVRASQALAVHAVVVDAMSEGAAAFYARYGFRPFMSMPRRLFLPLATFERAGL